MSTELSCLMLKASQFAETLESNRSTVLTSRSCMLIMPRCSDQQTTWLLKECTVGVDCRRRLYSLVVSVAVFQAAAHDAHALRSDNYKM